MYPSISAVFMAAEIRPCTLWTRLGGSTGWPDQKIDVFLNDFSNGRCALGVGEDRVLRDLEGLTVRVQEPFEGLSFDESGNCQALSSTGCLVPPANHVGLGTVLFGARTDAGHVRNGTLVYTLSVILYTTKDSTAL
jgi:hypothetical protein